MERKKARQKGRERMGLHLERKGETSEGKEDREKEACGEKDGEKRSE